MNAGSGGDTIASDDVAGVKYQVVKIDVGGDGAAAPLSATNPIPAAGTAAHDAAVSGAPLLQGGYASAAAPTGVSADGDAVRAWHLRNGAAATVVTAAGALIGGDATNGLDVDVTRTSIQGNVDTAAGATQIGVAALGVRDDALATLTEADGDLTLQRTNARGATWVALDSTAAQTVTLAASTATQEIVGDAAHDAAAAGNPVLIGGYASATEPADTSADGDAAQLWVLRSGLLPVTLRDSVGDSITDDTNNAVRVNIVAGAAAGGTSQADDADFTAGTTAGTPIQGVYESSPTSVTDGDLGTVGITATRALKVSVASGGIAGAVVDSVAGATDEGVLAVAVRDDALATLTPVDGDYTQLRTNARGAQWVALDSTAAQTVTLAAGTATNEVVGDAAADAAVAGNPLYMGARASTAIPTAMSADGDAVGAWADLNGALVVAGRIVDDAAFTPGTSRVHPIAFQADETATDSVDEGDAGCPRMTLDRKVIVTQYAHAAAGGMSNYTALSTAAVLTAEIKGSAGKVFSLECFNINAAARYVRLYNQTGAPASTDTANVVWQGVIPGATTGGGFTISWPMGKQFATGIGIRVSTGIAHNDTGALAANELTFNVSYV